MTLLFAVCVCCFDGVSYFQGEFEQLISKTMARSRKNVFSEDMGLAASNSPNSSMTLLSEFQVRGGLVVFGWG
jgi:hypothetical protein